MKVIIAGNEPAEIEELSRRLLQEGTIETCVVAATGEQLLSLAEEMQPDAVFLDPRLPEMSGMEAARALLTRADKPVLVFISEDGHYAAEAYALDASDYLVKPIAQQRLQDTLRRIRERLERKTASAKTASINRLLIQENGKITVVAPESVIAMIKDEKNVAVYTKEGRCYSSKLTLQELEERLKAYPFFRTHRSYLINLSDVEELIPWFNGAFNVKLRSAPELKVPVSRDAAKEIFRRLGAE